MGGPQPMAGRPFGQSRRARPHARPLGGSVYARRVAPGASLTKLGARAAPPGPSRRPWWARIPQSTCSWPGAHLYSAGPARGPLRPPAKAGLKKWRRLGALGWGWGGAKVWLLGGVPPVACHVHCLPPALRIFEAKGLEICSVRFGPRVAVRLPFPSARLLPPHSLSFLRFPYSPQIVLPSWTGSLGPLTRGCLPAFMTLFAQCQHRPPNPALGLAGGGSREGGG